VRKDDSILNVFLTLVRAGLWEKEARLLSFGEVDYPAVITLAEEQSVVGLVSAGIEHVTDLHVPKEYVLQIVGQTLQIEQSNNAMNRFIGVLMDKMRGAGIYALLVKGQGIAQCYERPLWRSCGDIDLLLSDDNYFKAKQFLSQIATSIEPEDCEKKHFGMTIDSWVVELHGTLRSGLSRRIDKVLDEIQESTFYGGNVRSWMNAGTQVFLPYPDNDIIFVFSHILQHFFKGGIGLRQICDLCRLTWAYRDTLDKRLLEKRLKKMRTMSEWLAFGSMAVDYLGMPESAYPLYSKSKRWSTKANRILSLIIETGNFGHNRHYSYYNKYPFVVYKALALWRNTKDSLRHFMIFPLDATRIWFLRLILGFRVAVKRDK
jgi:hypothetical protein